MALPRAGRRPRGGRGRVPGREALTTPPTTSTAMHARMTVPARIGIPPPHLLVSPEARRSVVAPP
ncbi:protein of unknown function [Streptantibioticus cattleyicolor NRRL 8057 = DSM 46488]|nr:protein of unknown function [Streptantibioticus cattleyicolor NRRL 8057 = DSM 46488]